MDNLLSTLAQDQLSIIFNRKKKKTITIKCTCNPTQENFELGKGGSLQEREIIIPMGKKDSSNWEKGGTQ